MCQILKNRTMLKGWKWWYSDQGALLSSLVILYQKLIVLGFVIDMPNLVIFGAWKGEQIELKSANISVPVYLKVKGPHTLKFFYLTLTSVDASVLVPCFYNVPTHSSFPGNSWLQQHIIYIIPVDEGLQNMVWLKVGWQCYVQRLILRQKKKNK